MDAAPQPIGHCKLITGSYTVDQPGPRSPSPPPSPLTACGLPGTWCQTCPCPKSCPAHSPSSNQCWRRWAGSMTPWRLCPWPAPQSQTTARRAGQHLVVHRLQRPCRSCRFTALQLQLLGAHFNTTHGVGTVAGRAIPAGPLRVTAAALVFLFLLTAHRPAAQPARCLPPFQAAASGLKAADTKPPCSLLLHLHCILTLKAATLKSTVRCSSPRSLPFLVFTASVTSRGPAPAYCSTVRYGSRQMLVSSRARVHKPVRAASG